MQIPYDHTVEILDNIHRLRTKGTIPFPISLSRVGDGSGADQEFVAWVKNRWPEFAAVSHPRADWTGSVPSAEQFDIPDISCGQFFRLNILADGTDAFCCMDPNGEHGYGNVKDTPPLDLYNHPSKRELRKNLPSRLTISVCQHCPVLS